MIKKSKDHKTILVRMPITLYDRVKALSIALVGSNVTAHVNKAIAEYLERYEK